MVNGGLTRSGVSIRVRQIAASDVDAVVGLLDKGFGPRRDYRFWQHVMAVLAARPTFAGLPQFGYLLESGATPVGVLLMIFSTPRWGGDGDHGTFHRLPAVANGLSDRAPSSSQTVGSPRVRCNVSSWFVEPRFRGYAALLSARALRHQDVTYLDISPAPVTVPILDAQGWTRYSAGLFVAIPSLQHGSRGIAARLVAGNRDPGAPCEPFERALLVEHAAHGCLSFWCVTAERAYPFVFRRRLAREVLPCGQLIYCRDVSDVARFAGLIGRHLLMRGCPVAIIDSNGPVPGLVGRYIEGFMPKYFKGPVRPRLGDLAYTETALFGM